MTAIGELGWELLPHPPYSPDLAPSDFHLFAELKKPMRGKRYDSLKEVKKDLKKWIDSTPKQFFETGLRQLVSRWQKCLELRGNYVEEC